MHSMRLTALAGLFALAACGSAGYKSSSGAVFTTSGTGFRNDSTDFSEINPAYAADFTFFSANKIFAPSAEPRQLV
jgi:hypothetical protein